MPFTKSHAIAFLRAIMTLTLATASPVRAEIMTFVGTLGTAKIGMTIDVADEKVGGPVAAPSHYFYRAHLTDIPLQGVVAAETVLKEPSGGIFTLHFVGNGSEHGAPLTLYNSVGLAGTWTSGTRTLPVSLKNDWGGPSGQPRYADVGGVTDPMAFETKVRTFLADVLADRREAAAGLVDYPLRVNKSGKSRTIRDKTALLAAWNTIFTSQWQAAAADATPHDMFVHDGQAMVAGGIAWFDGTGLASINEVR